MTRAAAQARQFDLVRMEQAAGQAFGYAEEAETARAAQAPALLTQVTLGLATVATAVAATLTYLV